MSVSHRSNRQRPGLAWVLGVVFFLGGVIVGSSVLNAPADSSVTGVEAAKYANADAKTMLKAFIKAQRAELRALEHRHKFELKEMKSSHGAQSKEWEARERDARHKFFEEHPKGVDRRPFVTSFLVRRKAMVVTQKEEIKKKAEQFETEHTALEQEQAKRLKEFQAALERKEVPDASLWPRAGS
jgi:hypothetical protein